MLGDAAAAPDVTGARLPATAQVAVQQAECAADNLVAALRGRAAQSFVPRLEGEALSLGPHRGLARVGKLALEDTPALIVNAWRGHATSASSAGRRCRSSSARASTSRTGCPNRCRQGRSRTIGRGAAAMTSGQPDGPVCRANGATSIDRAQWRHAYTRANRSVWLGRSVADCSPRSCGGAQPGDAADPRLRSRNPAGFEPNSARVAGRLADFLRHRLAPFDVHVEVVPARKRGTLLSPDEPEVVAPLLTANYLVLGPGSPTYAAKQLDGSLAWHTILARHRLGAPLILASAAAIAASAHALPVYEIYKVGEDLGWKAGLNLLGPFGRSVAIIPHWNNHDGGEELDTSRGYLGQVRFERLLDLLPPDVDVVGIDEHTALMLDFAAGQGAVFGAVV